MLLGFNAFSVFIDLWGMQSAPSLSLSLFFLFLCLSLSRSVLFTAFCQIGHIQTEETEEGTCSTGGKTKHEGFLYESYTSFLVSGYSNTLGRLYHIVRVTLCMMETVSNIVVVAFCRELRLNLWSCCIFPKNSYHHTNKGIAILCRSASPSPDVRLGLPLVGHRISWKLEKSIPVT